tara:strand:- start:574 stop:771 length:198 start_codon:yes stop_codon:yes gene_type:complete
MSSITSYLYNSYYFDSVEVEKAQEQIEFLENKLLDTPKKLTDEQKESRINRIRQTIKCIKYYYTI